MEREQHRRPTEEGRPNTPPLRGLGEAVSEAAGWDPGEKVGDIYAVTIEPGRDPEIEKVYEGVPEIYVASLADYNAGKYHGTWIDATLDPDEIRIRIATMLRHSPVLRAEGETFGDWAIHDYDGFGGIRLGELEDPEYINAVALGISEYGDAFAAWVDINGLPEPRNPDTLVQQFRDAYLGQYASLDDYGETIWDDMGWQSLIESVLPPEIARNGSVMAHRLADDMWKGGDIQIAHTDGGRIWVFRGDI